MDNHYYITQKSKMDEIAVPCSRYGVKTTCRMRCDELIRPKSANRVKEDLCSRLVQPAQRSSRTDRNTITPKRQLGKPFHIPKIIAGLPDQETIERHEELEVHLTDYSDQTQKYLELNEQAESITSWSDKVIQLKIDWQDKLVQFDKLKIELVERLRAMMELYANMQVTHKKMWTLGEKAELPLPDNLHIMNVAKLTPVQLLQLCTKSRHIEEKVEDAKCLAKAAVTLDVNKIYKIPAKLVDTCELTLCKMKELIDWFESIRKVDKCISMQNLAKKLGDFTKENEILNYSLEKDKNECYEELKIIVDILRKGVNETMALQLRTEEMTLELSEVNSRNDNLRKQLHNTDHYKSPHNKYRYEELEKELKEERSKKILVKDRLSRADGQVKIATVRISQLETKLEQNRLQNRTLDRTIQQLHDQNHKLQVDFEEELNKLRECIKENTAQLEEIADSRQKLQSEKERLEKLLEEQSEQYNESLKNLKEEMDINVVKILDLDKKHQNVIEDKKNLEEKVGSLCAQLVQSELSCKDLRKRLQDSESQLNKSTNCQLELESSKRDLNKAKLEIEDYRNRLMNEVDAIKEIERSYKETLELEESHKRELINKNEYIMAMEKKQSLLEQQLQESESKITLYEKQLLPLKHDISKLQEAFGDFEDLNELYEMINQQRAKLLEVTRQNDKIKEALHNKDLQLESYLKNRTENERLLEQKSDTIKMLSEKEQEQANIIKLLRNNLEKQAQADNDLNQQLSEKKMEINTLLTTLETRKQQISEFEKIILTLEDQTRKDNVQISQLEKIILTLEDESQKNCTEMMILQKNEARQTDRKRSIDIPSDNLDKFIKSLENELGIPPDPQMKSSEQSHIVKTNFFGNLKAKPNKLDFHDRQSPIHDSESIKMPKKIGMGNFVKKTSTNEEQLRGDNKDHSPCRVAMAPTKENNFASNIRFYDQLREDKKMLKFAGHRL